MTQILTHRRKSAGWHGIASLYPCVTHRLAAHVVDLVFTDTACGKQMRPLHAISMAPVADERRPRFVHRRVLLVAVRVTNLRLQFGFIAQPQRLCGRSC